MEGARITDALDKDKALRQDAKIKSYMAEEIQRMNFDLVLAGYAKGITILSEPKNTQKILDWEKKQPQEKISLALGLARTLYSDKISKAWVTKIKDQNLSEATLTGLEYDFFKKQLIDTPKNELKNNHLNFASHYMAESYIDPLHVSYDKKKVADLQKALEEKTKE